MDVVASGAKQSPGKRKCPIDESHPLKRRLLRREEHPPRNDMVWMFCMAIGREYCVYIMTNTYNTVLYTGVTNDLARRVHEHKNGLGSIFTKKYNVVKLVYYEITDNVYAAIAREKQIKGGSRKKKIDLIESMNSEWKDLYDEII